MFIGADRANHRRRKRTMKPIVRNLVLGALGLAVAATVASGALNFTAFAQVAAPSASTPLPEATVKALQEALSKQGIAVKADGVWGDDTRAAVRKYQSQHHLPVTGEPDKATLDKLGVAGQRSEASGGPATAGVPAPGMMGMMGGMAGQGASQGGMGPGMMSPDMMQMMRMQGDESGQSGMMMCPVMAMMMPRQAGDGQPATTRRTGMGVGMGTGMGVGPGMFYGMAQPAQEEMTPERVRGWLEQRLAQHANPRLKIGTIAKAESGEVTAEIVTVDGSLVQKLAFNRYPGFVRALP
jgi:hypothetical protein